MRLEIADNVVPAGELAQRYAEARKRLMTGSKPVVEPEKEPEPVLTEDGYREAITKEAASILFFPCQAVVDEFRALARRCNLQQPTMALIVYEVCRFYEITHAEIMSERRFAATVYARHVAMYLCRDMMTHSLSRIGRFFKDRDHTTVIHACRSIQEKMKTNERLADDIAVLKLRIIEGLS